MQRDNIDFMETVCFIRLLVVGMCCLLLYTFFRYFYLIRYLQICVKYLCVCECMYLMKSKNKREIIEHLLVNNIIVFVRIWKMEYMMLKASYLKGLGESFTK